MKDKLYLTFLSGLLLMAVNIYLPNKIYWKLAILDFSIFAIITLVEIDEDFKEGFQSVW